MTFSADPRGPVLISARTPELPCTALWSAGRALPLQRWRDVLGPLANAGPSRIIDHWLEGAEALRALLTDPGTHALIAAEGQYVDLERLGPPIVPGQVFCTIGNYRSQLVEAAADAGDGPAGPGADGRRAAAAASAAERSRHGSPYISLTSRARVTGPRGTLPLPRGVRTLDWEVELAAVVGRRAWRVPPERALDHVAGWCVANDLTVRDSVFRADLPAMGTDWLACKGLPGTLPLGPFLVPAWQVGDPSRLRLQLRLNGRVMQDGAADDMVFDVARQLSWLSHQTPLEPGDVLCTGSPAGFGTHHGRMLQPGDVLTAEIDGLGTQQHTVVLEPEAATASAA